MPPASRCWYAGLAVLFNHLVTNPGGVDLQLEPLTVAELLRATGSLVSLAKCTWMTIARLKYVRSPPFVRC